VEIEMIPNAHHVTALANPEKVNQQLLRFFAE
jgi:pimeloyl-ACP methyl ester carboxylesterase